MTFIKSKDLAVPCSRATPVTSCSAVSPPERSLPEMKRQVVEMKRHPKTGICSHTVYTYSSMYLENRPVYSSIFQEHV